MSHTVIIYSDSLLEVFDPAIPEYAGVRDHFTVHELERLDEYRLRPHPAKFSLLERLDISAALTKVVMTAENEPGG
jgi:hypothetical protein